MGKIEILNTDKVFWAKFATLSVGELQLSTPSSFVTHDAASSFKTCKSRNRERTARRAWLFAFNLALCELVFFFRSNLLGCIV